MCIFTYILYVYIYVYVYIAEWSVVRDIGEAEASSLFFFPSDSRDRGPFFEPDLVVVNTIARRACEIYGGDSREQVSLLKGILRSSVPRDSIWMSYAR